MPTLYNVGYVGSHPGIGEPRSACATRPCGGLALRGPPYNYVSPNPKSYNSVSSFTFRDITVFGPPNTDILVKVNSTFCPLVGQQRALRVRAAGA